MSCALANIPIGCLREGQSHSRRSIIHHGEVPTTTVSLESCATQDLWTKLAQSDMAWVNPFLTNTQVAGGAEGKRRNTDE